MRQTGIKKLAFLRGCVEATWTGAIVQIEGRMDPTKYQQILDAIVLQSVRKCCLQRGWLLQQDKELKQTSEFTMNHFLNHKL